jgi:2-polyprenyl-3-methyl-5-hydroxy-6-metoxy-1,4-benzoquinol methylase
MTQTPQSRHRILIGGLRRIERWSGQAKRRLSAPSGAPAEAREAAEPKPTKEASDGYGQYWQPLEQTEARRQIYNSEDADHFEEGGKADCDSLRPYFTATSTVLDLGCGTGRVARYVAAECAQLWAVDASTRMLELAAERMAHIGNVRYARCYDVKIPDVASESIDLVYSLLVLQHLEREDAFLLLQELRRIVKPTGTVFLTFPNLLSDVYLNAFVSDAALTPRNPVRARIYTPQEVDRLLSEVGFSVEIDPDVEIRAVCRPIKKPWITG